jgi:putative sterol carrier protein
MVEQLFREMIAKFNQKSAEDPKLAKELAGVRRVVEIDVTDGDSYNFVLENSHVGEMSIGKVEKPDILVIGSKETFLQMRSGELRPMKALALKKIQVKATLEDMLRLRKFF